MNYVPYRGFQDPFPVAFYLIPPKLELLCILV